jgi:hypothetical protein
MIDVVRFAPVLAVRYGTDHELTNVLPAAMEAARMEYVWSTGVMSDIVASLASVGSCSIC